MNNQPIIGSPISAILFDLDGVVVDSTEVIENSWNTGAKLFNMHISNNDMQQFVHGQPAHQTLKNIFSELSDLEQKKLKKIVDRTEEQANYHPIPGVLALIDTFHKIGLPMALVTSSWNIKIKNILHQLNLHNRFSSIVSRDDVINCKPAPDPYLLAAKQLSLQTKQCLVFEDSKSGVNSALSAGCYCIGINKTATQLNVNYKINDFTCLAVKNNLKNHKLIDIDKNLQLANLTIDAD